jgi:hyperosmotically inducible periplasmic protein
MIRRLLRAVALSGAVAISAIGITSAADKDTGNKGDAGAVQPDNSRVNKEDRSKGALTADQQKENPADRKMTQQIRRAIVKDKSLSTYAHNVKIITHNGVVTLKGAVRTDAEKAKVEQIASGVAAGKVTNELTVAKKMTKQEKKQEKGQQKEMKEQQKENKEAK